MSLASRLAALAAAALLVLPASAQSVDVTGTVTDGTDPILRARVTIQAGDATGDTLGVAFTDAAGDFAVVVQGTPSEAAPAATDYAIGNAFPNPASGDRATVRFTTPGDRAERPTVETFDLLGRQTTPGAPLAAGAYLVRLRFADGTVSATRRLVVARSGVEVAAEQVRGGLDAPVVRAAARAAQVVFVTVERAGFVTETRTVDATGGADLGIALGAAPAPTASIADPGTVQAGTALTLDGTASVGADGEDLSYSWDFGNGMRGGTARVAHVYTEAGTYTVTLTVQGAFGATASTTASVTVTAPPDPAGTAPVRLVVTGTTGGIIPDAVASVVGGTASATTDGEGVAVIDAVPTGVPVAIAVTKAGFATQRVALDLPEAASEPTTIEVTLGARRPAQTMPDAELGGMTMGTEGVMVEIPVEGLVHADGSLVTGDVSVSLTPVDISDDAEIGAFPGAFAGVTPDGPADLILSYGTAEYVFEQDGEELNLAPGKTATVEIPIYAAQDENGDDLAVGDPFPLWSLDEMTGEWVLEGEGVVVASAASPTGFALRAEVTHFSWWNCDIAPDPFYPVPRLSIGGGAAPFGPGETGVVGGTFGGGDGSAGPRGRATEALSPNNAIGLPVPPDTDVVLEATARGGTLKGETVVNGSAGESATVAIVLTPVETSAGGTIAPDTTVTGLIETTDETDTFTFAATAGRFVSVEAVSGTGSTLNGRVTVETPGGQVIDQASYTSARGRIAFLAPATGLYTITVDGTRNVPGVYDLKLLERTLTQIAAESTVESRIDAVGDEKAFAFTATDGAYSRLTIGRPEGSRLDAILYLFGPDGQEVETVILNRATASIALPPAASGTYSAVVDGRFNEPGDFTLRYVERTPQPVDLGTEQVETVGPLGDLFVYAFEGAAGESFDLYLGGPDLTSGRAEVLGPDERPIRAVGLMQSGFFDLDASGTYTVVVDAFDGPGDLTTAFREVPELALDTEVTGTLRRGERWRYAFTPTAPTFVRPGVTSPEGTTPSGSITALDGAPLVGREFGIFEVGAGRYQLVASVATSEPASFRAAVAEIEAPEPLTIDAAGRATVTGSLDVLGDLALYRVDTPVGSGLMTRLTADGDGPLAPEATVTAAVLQAGETIPAFNRTVDGFNVSTREQATNGATPEGLLEAYGARLPEGVGYVIAVAPVANVQTSNLGQTPTGGFALRADVAAPSAAIEVDDDLAQCASADTRSLHAALLAAPEGATVTACAGRYAEAVSALVLNGLTLAGTDRDGVVLAHEVVTEQFNPIVLNGNSSGPDDGLTVRDLTIETGAQAAWLRGDDLVVERVTILTASGSDATRLRGIQTTGENGRIEDVRIETGQFGITASSATGLQVLNSTFVGTASFALVNVSGSDDVTVQGNTFEVGDGAAIHLLSSSNSGHLIADNTITVGDDGTRTTQGVVALGVGSETPSETVVRGNVVMLADGGDPVFNLDARREARLVAEDNEVRVADPDGAQVMFAATQQGGEVVVRNNVFDGARSFRGVDLFATPDASTSFVNNSVRVASGANTSSSAQLVTPRGTAAGALPITVVNNVLVGVGGSTVGIATTSGFTVTADHNLLFGFATAYGGNASGGAGDVVGQDPQFTNDRLDVAAGSPAVDAGATSATFPDVPTDDVDGTARPQGAAVDIGAHEQ